MRIFIPVLGEDSIAKIAGEMFNIEAGKELYDNGISVLSILPADKKPAAYPSWTSKSGAVITTIRASRGLLILPTVVPGDAFINLITQALENLEREYYRINGTSHFNQHMMLNTSMEHFTILRGKSSKLERKIISMLAYSDIPNTWDIYRFIWVIYPITDYLYNPSKDTLQLTGIIYDANKIFTFQNNTSTHHQITLRHTKIGSQFHDIIYTGEVNQDCINKMQKKLNIMKLAITDQHEADPRSIAELQVLIESYNLYKSDANFILSYMHGKLYLCPIRKAAYEIIRHLGQWELYSKLLMYPQLHKLTCTVEGINYTALSIPDKCAHCQTPLYDDIYVVHQMPICAICMHSKWTNDELDNAGKLLYNDDDIIYKTTYPRSAADLIAQLPIDDIVKNILLAAQIYGCSIEYCATGRCLYIGGATSTKKYIAWSGTIADYVLFYTATHLEIDFTTIPAFYAYVL